MGRLLTLLRPKGDFSPLDVDGLDLWLDASDESTITESGGAVSAWTSKDANAREFTQATGSLQPTTGASLLNGRNVLAFAGDYLTSTAAAGTFNFLHDGTTYTIFIVAKFGTVADPNAVYGVVGTTAASASIGMCVLWDDRVSASRNERLIHFVSRGVTNEFAVENRSSDDFWAPNEHALLTLEADPDNGTAASRSTFARNSGTPVANNVLTGAVSTSDHSNALQIGAAGNAVAPLTGEIAEIIAYARALTGTEIGNVESYLARKWGLGFS